MLEDVAEGDPAAMAELIATFVRHTIDGIAKVRAAVDANRLTEVVLAVHTCVGFTATIGITGLVPTLRELERAAREGQRDDLARLLERWEQEFGQVQQALEIHVKGGDIG